MIILTACFILFSHLAGSIIGGVFGNSEAIHMILAVGIFAAIALWFVPQTKGYAFGIAGVLIVAYVALQVLAPYTSVLITVIAAIATVVVLVMVKRPMIRYLRNGNGRNLPTWVRVCLTLL